MSDFSGFEIVGLDGLSEEYKNGVWELLVEADKEFVPPLSERESSVQKKLNSRSEAEAGGSLPYKYFESISNQSFLIALKDNKIMGFLTYRPGYEIELDNDNIMSSYVSTIIVSKEMRNLGATKKMYNYLVNVCKDKYISTRTWSENKSHIHILESLGFELIKTIPNDRGEGIDTVYYAKEVN